jgi:hypothetical protein
MVHHRGRQIKAVLSTWVSKVFIRELQITLEYLVQYGPTETEDWMDKQTSNQTKLYNLETDGKFYVSYPRQEQTVSEAATFCWNDDATAAVPYPEQAKAIVSKYAAPTTFYTAAIFRAAVNQTKWVTADGEYDGRRLLMVVRVNDPNCMRTNREEL